MFLPPACHSLVSSTDSVSWVHPTVGHKEFLPDAPNPQVHHLLVPLLMQSPERKAPFPSSGEDSHSASQVQLSVTASRKPFLTVPPWWGSSTLLTELLQCFPHCQGFICCQACGAWLRPRRLVPCLLNWTEWNVLSPLYRFPLYDRKAHYVPNEGAKRPRLNNALVLK